MKIYIYGSPILRKKATKITKVDKKLEKVIHDMFITMEHNEPRGVGLAATQIGLLQSFLYMSLKMTKVSL